MKHIKNGSLIINISKTEKGNGIVEKPAVQGTKNMNNSII